MENCLVKNLKGSFSDNSLLKLGECRLNAVVSAGTTGIIFFNTTGNITLKSNIALKVNQGNDLVTEYTGVLNRLDLKTEGDYAISIIAKNKISAASLYQTSCILKVNTESFTATTIQDILTTTIDGFIEDLPSSLVNLTTNNGETSQIIGSLADFSSTVLEHLDLRKCPNISGELKDIKSNAINYIGLGIGTTGIVGSVDDLADRLYANGKTSGTLVVFPGNGIVTCDGQVIGTTGGKTITFSAGGWTHD